MIDVNIMKQYLGTGLKCKIQSDDDVLELVGVLDWGDNYECWFKERAQTYFGEDVFPILHPLSDLDVKVMYKGKLTLPFKFLTLDLTPRNGLSLQRIVRNRIATNTLSLVDALVLYEMGFDLDGLIGRKEAVDINSLKTSNS